MNRPETHVFIATSLDGFIARPDGSLDWLLQAQAAAPAGEDFGYAAFMAGIDALVLGRKTYQTVLGFDPWPYGTLPVHVVSHQAALSVPEALQPAVRQCTQTPAELLAALGGQGIRHMVLDGGELIQSFLFDDLVDHITVTHIPVLLGQGRRLWGPLPADRAWSLGQARHWECGFVQCRWARRR
jgi:dihydrofolate reductase